MIKRGAPWGEARRQAREDARLRRLPRYTATETILHGRRIQVVDAPTYLSARAEILERRCYDFESSVAKPRILDGGANIGISSIFFQQRYPAARITAYEADPAIAGVLRNNLDAFGFNAVEMKPVALWVEQGEVEFCLEGGMSGRVPMGEGDAVRRIRVPAVRLRDELAREPVEMLKLDIEGAETAVLKDCRDYVRKDWIRHLFFEYHSHVQEAQSLHELLALLQAGGYRYYLTPAYISKHPFLPPRLLVGMEFQINVYAC